MKSKPSKKPRHITARSITLKDAKGKTRIHMDAGDGNGHASICIFSGDQRSIQISTQPDGTLVVALHCGISQAVFGMRPDGEAGMSLTDNQGRLGTQIGSRFDDTKEHNLSIFRDGKLHWTTRKPKKKKRTPAK